MNNEMLKLIDEVEPNEISNSLNKVSSLQVVIKKTLKKGHDYDVIPGTNKPTLLKPGAEKILMMFGITSEYEVVSSVEDWKNGVFAYTVRCILSKSGNKITEGLGNCNSKEDKYRYRWVKAQDVPMGVDAETLKSNQYGKLRIENDEIYSIVNTILKMAKKRAQIDATLTVASLSEVFTQDAEDMKNFIESEKIENMNFEDAEKIIVTFGKYKGEKLVDIANKDMSYIHWLADKATTPELRVAAQKFITNKDPNNGTDKGQQDNPDDINNLFPPEDLPFN